MGGMGWGGYKAWQIYKQAILVRQDAFQIRNLVSASGSKLEQIKLAVRRSRLFPRILVRLKAKAVHSSGWDLVKVGTGLWGDLILLKS